MSRNGGGAPPVPGSVLGGGVSGGDGFQPSSGGGAGCSPGKGGVGPLPTGGAVVIGGAAGAGGVHGLPYSNLGGDGGQLRAAMVQATETDRAQDCQHP